MRLMESAIEWRNGNPVIETCRGQRHRGEQVLEMGLALFSQRRVRKAWQGWFRFLELGLQE